MGIQETSNLIHWNYFIALEADIERLSRYVEFTANNFNTFSIEIAHLLLSASSEVDMVAQQLCQSLDNTTSAGSIDQYRNVIKTNIPSNPAAFLKAIDKCRDDIVVSAECLFTWYWLADLCAED